MRLLLVVFLLFPAICFAQNYQPIGSNHVRFFHTDDPFTDDLNDDGFDDYGVKMDSVIVDDGDSVFYNYQQVRAYDGFQFGGTCAYKRYSWLGLPVVVKSNGWTHFVNQDQDSIKVNHAANASDTWIALEVNNLGFLWATVEGIAIENVLGQSENVKTISFQMKNSVGQNISHFINGTTIKIGETLGLIEAMDFYHFPDHIEATFVGSVPLTGIDEQGLGIRRMTPDELFEEFEVGDEFAHRTRVDYHSPMHFDAEVYNTLVQIIGKETVPQLEYTVLVHSSSNTYQIDPITGPYYHFQSQTITETYTDHSFYAFYQPEILDNMPGVMYDFPHYDPSFNTAYRELNDTLEFLAYNNRMDSLQPDGCINDMTFEASEWDVLYQEHLGAVYAYWYWHYDDTEFNLTYLKRGNHIYGEPVTPSVILSDREVERSIEPAIYPNPVSVGATLNLGALCGEAEILDLSGKVVCSKTNTKVLETHGLSPGIYFIKTTSEGNSAVQRLVITD